MKKIELREIFAKNFINLMSSNNVTRKQVSEDLNFSYSKVCDWSRARTYPDQIELTKLASYFSRTIDELTAEVEEYEEDGGITIDTKRQTVRIYDFETNRVIGRELVSYKDCDPDVVQVMFYVNDDLMLPKFEIGDLIMAKRVLSTDNIIDGDYLLRNPGNPLFIHIYCINDKEIVISPINIKNSKNILPYTILKDELLKNYSEIYLATRFTRILDK